MANDYILKIRTPPGTWSIPAAVATTPNEPDNPVEGQLWFDPAEAPMGDAWIGPDPGPDNPRQGQLWLREPDLTLLVRYDSTWIAINA